MVHASQQEAASPIPQAHLGRLLPAVGLLLGELVGDEVGVPDGDAVGVLVGLGLGGPRAHSATLGHLWSLW